MNNSSSSIPIEAVSNENPCYSDTLAGNDSFRNYDDYMFSENELASDVDESEDDEDLDTSNDEIDDVQNTESNTSEPVVRDEFSSTTIESPGGTRVVSWIPNVDKEFEPEENMEFETLDKGMDFYYKYARKAGFDVRKGSTKWKRKLITHRYYICNRAGKAATKDIDTLHGVKGKRKCSRPSMMCECPAKIGFKVIQNSDKCFVKTFTKMHNHVLYTTSTIHMSRHKRKLDFYDKNIIHQLNQSNVGATRAHSMVGGLKGGYDKQGPKKIDYKNHARDLNCYIGSSDASLVINLMELRQRNLPNFTFKFFTEDNALRGMFWADAIAKRNYREFSDVVSFDATFRTNKYKMVFVPFTGIDNHKRCITFGAGLLAKETIEYYTWLLESFIGAFGEQPRIIVADQDPAMAKAVEKVLPKSTHRLCMWHIGKKLTDKVSAKVLKGNDFKKRLQALIWNGCNTPEVFEEKWKYIIDEFKLDENKWLKDMYAIRSSWIPSYFQDVALSGLMRTTSRSESENYFFQSFLSKKSNLLMFICKFDTAMDKQRIVQLSSDFDSVSKNPRMETILPFEVQASRFYTLTIFYIFQKEIFDAVWSCSPGPVLSLDKHDSCIVFEQFLGGATRNKSIFWKPGSEDFRSDDGRRFKYQVRVYEDHETYQCECMAFEQYGILCRHILCIMKTSFRKTIPNKYLLRRWQKDIISPEELQKHNAIGNSSGGCQNMINEAFSIMSECVSIVGHDVEAMTQFLEWQKEIKMKIEENPPKKDSRMKEQILGDIIGLPKPVNDEIRNPHDIRNKGSAGGKRMQSNKEVAMKNVGKEGKNCTFCKKKIMPAEKQDRRNCPLRKQLDSQKGQSNNASDDAIQDAQSNNEAGSNK